MLRFDGLRFARINAVLFLIFYLSFCKGETPKKLSEESLRKLKSIPYLTWVEANDTEEKSGVIFHDPERACHGLNVYTSRNLAEARLMDMAGNILHGWKAAPGRPDPWQHVELSEELDLYAVVKDKRLVCLDWDSRVKRSRPLRFHHDVSLGENGGVYALTREDDFFFVHGFPLPVLNSSIVFFSSEGVLVRKVSLFPFFKSYFDRRMILDIYAWAACRDTWEKMEKRRKEHGYMFTNEDPADVLHINSMEMLDRDIPGVCRKGHFLVCALRLNLVAVIDPESGSIVWQWGPGVLSQPHHPTMLENGNILIFDNGVSRKYSRVVEVDPARKKIVWEYRAKPSETFFSVSRGANQRLPNGNTLITESDRGHVFEVTARGDVVWEFFNPERRDSGKKRAAIYRMMRITEKALLNKITDRCGKGFAGK